MSTLGYIVGIPLLAALVIYAGYYAVQLAAAVKSGMLNGSFLKLMDTGVELAVLFLFYTLIFGKKKKK